MNRMIIRLLLACALLIGSLQAQSDVPLAFEVASIKPHAIPGGGFLRRPASNNLRCPPFKCGISGNRFNEEGASLVDLIMDAYNLKRFQVSGLPPWGDSGRDVYDIAATVEGNRTPTVAEARQMLQTLLADRFQLKFHREKKELPVYALVVAKNGPKLKQQSQEEGIPPAPCPTASPRPQRLSGDGGGGDKGGPRGGGGGKGGGPPPGIPVDVLTFMRSWERMPEIMAGFVDRPVIDKTGLEGMYCTTDGQDPMMAVMSQVQPPGGRGRGGSDGPPGAGADGDSGGASLFTVVQEKLGLKLELQKLPTEILMVDRVERPSGN